MEKADLTDPSYWESPGVDIRLNPRLRLETEGLSEFVRSELGLAAAVVFATSGSTGSGPKFVILEKRAILASAEAVNRHLEVSETDRWLCALTTFHVGGLGVWARAGKAGCPAFGIDGEKWDRSGGTFAKACSDHDITLTALTPTHLYDVIANRHAAPESLRAVLIGGGTLDESLLKDAVRLGWPILRTYGMTETASQIATDSLNAARLPEREEFLPVLAGWDVAADEGRLSIRGRALFHGYAVRDPETGAWVLSRPISEDGFFTTSDRVEMAESDSGVETMLSFRGRADDRVKKLGELVALDQLRAGLRKHFSECPVTIVARSHHRMGQELIAVVERANAGHCRTAITAFNASVAPYERIDRFCRVDKMPETGIGKIAHGRLVAMMDARKLALLPIEGEPDHPQG